MEKEGKFEGGRQNKNGKRNRRRNQDQGENMACGKRGKRNELLCEIPQEAFWNTTWLLTGQKFK